MTQGKCIYCNEVKPLNKEHAFPKALLHNCVQLKARAPEWIIEKLCEDCNNRRSGILDKTLVTKSPMAVVWRIIKSEWEEDSNCKSQDAAFYNAKGYGIRPVNLFYPDELYDNLIMLHEEMGTSVPEFHPTLLGLARVPQLILIQYTGEQTAEQIIVDNYEQWISGEISVEPSAEHDGVYCISDKYLVFNPKATKYFIASPEREQEFVTEFIKNRGSLQFYLHVLFPDDRNIAGQLEGFCKRLGPGIEKEFPAKRFEPHKSPGHYLMVAADKKAIPYSKRAISKIAFHCFLYFHPDFSGHEPIFDGVRAYISGGENHQTSYGEDFITKVTLPRACISSSNEHSHIFRFYVCGDSIICQIAFFTGLFLGNSDTENPELFAREIVLAGSSQEARSSQCNQRHMPFYVHGKSQLKRRIIIPALSNNMPHKSRYTLQFAIEQECLTTAIVLQSLLSAI